MTDDIFDFGFTAVDENELDVVQKAAETVQTASSTLEELQDKVDSLFNAIMPLLSNLKKNPEKDYIYWPNRIDKVEQFETHLLNIYNK